MPIIVVFTKTQDENISQEMEKFIKEQKIDVLFVQTVAKDIKLDKENNSRIKSYGKEELLKITLELGTKSLQGGLIKLMIKNISMDLIKEMKEENKKNENILKEKIIKDFINEYKIVLKDKEFIEHLINILLKSLEIFYEDHYKISNKTHKLLNESKYFNHVKKFIKSVKKKTKELILPIIKEKSKDFINIQAQNERKHGNLSLEKKRIKKGFQKTSEIFLKKNFYYNAQKFIIKYTMENIYQNVIGNYRKILDLIVEDLLNLTKEENKDIKSQLEFCYLVKLKAFAEKRNVKVKIPLNSSEVIKNYLPNIEDDKELYRNNINTNSFDLGKDFNVVEDGLKIKESIKNKNDSDNNKWFPLIKKKFKYLSEEDKTSISKFLNDIEKQNSFVDQESEDKIFKSLNSNINKDLLIFINQNKKDFISFGIDKIYGDNKFSFKTNICSDIIINQNFKSIYESKLINEFDLLINNNEFTKIDYLTILIIGKSGVGKSTLVNCMLKGELAQEGVGFIVTEGDHFYRNEKINFLNLIDTRGYELNKEFSPKIIYEQAMKTISKQISDNEKNQNYNNYVQCIWYCVNESYIDEEEIKLISKLKGKEKEKEKEKEKSIPLIIVFTNAINIEEINKMKELIQNKFPELPFIDVLGRSTTKKEKYGLDDLLNLTLKSCKNVEQGDVYNKIKDILKQKVTNIFK